MSLCKLFYFIKKKNEKNNHNYTPQYFDISSKFH